MIEREYVGMCNTLVRTSEFFYWDNSQQVLEDGNEDCGSRNWADVDVCNYCELFSTDA